MIQQDSVRVKQVVDIKLDELLQQSSMCIEWLKTVVKEEYMPIQVNSRSSSYLKGLVEKGEVNTSSDWSWDAADGNNILGEEEDWDALELHHLAVDTDEEPETKAYYKYPVAKDGTIYRSGLIAAKQRAGAQDANAVLNAADELLRMIDEEKTWREEVYNQIVSKVRNVLFPESTKKYEGINFEPPEHVKAALRKGLRLHEEGKSGDGLQPETVSWARRLSQGEEASPDKVKKAVGWFARHEEASKTPGWDKAGEETPGYVAWLLWGDNGNGKGRAWWERVRNKMQQEDTKDLPLSFTVRKDSDGNWRWFGVASNNYLDRDGEIITHSAHVEFEKYLDENPDAAPELWSWHTPGTAARHKADWWHYSDGFFHYSGILTEEEADNYAGVDEIELGMSHGFFVLDQKGPYITRYRTFEVSDLPREAAANPYTSFRFDQLKEKEMFSERKRSFLVSKYGEEAVAGLEGDTEEAKAALEELGVERKEMDAEYEAHLEEELAEKVSQNMKPMLEGILGVLNVEELQKALAQLNDGIRKNATALERLDEVEEKVDHLLKTEDEKIAQAISKQGPIDWDALSATNRNEKVEEEEVDEETARGAKQANESIGWLKGMAPQ